jgi:hypothetical protein
LPQKTSPKHLVSQKMQHSQVYYNKKKIKQQTREKATYKEQKEEVSPTTSIRL